VSLFGPALSRRALLGAFLLGPAAGALSLAPGPAFAASGIP
jgi:hypothetical protein